MRTKPFKLIGTGTTVTKVGGIEKGLKVNVFKPNKDTEVFDKNKNLFKPDYMIALHESNRDTYRQGFEHIHFGAMKNELKIN